MKLLKGIVGGLCLCAAIGCTAPASQKENTATPESLSQSEAVIKTIMDRRSIRQYKPQPVNRDTMQTILNVGSTCSRQSGIYQRRNGTLQEEQPQGSRRPVVQKHVPQRTDSSIHCQCPVV